MFFRNTKSQFPVCQNCGTQAESATQKFCMRCGAPFSASGFQNSMGNYAQNQSAPNNLICSSCGSPAEEEGQKFCMRCGAPLIGEQNFAPAPALAPATPAVPAPPVLAAPSPAASTPVAPALDTTQPPQHNCVQPDVNNYDDESFTSVLDQNPQEADEFTTVLDYQEPPKVVLVRAKTGETYELSLPSVIGKGSAANCKISGNSAISRKHIQISQSDTDSQIYMLTVLGSTNKTAIDNITIPTGDSKEILDGQTITLADEDFVFRVIDSSSSQFSVF